MKTVKSILSKIFSVLLTEAVIKMLILWGLEQAAKRSENKVDDELVKLVKEALNDPSKTSS